MSGIRIFVSLKLTYLVNAGNFFLHKITDVVWVIYEMCFSLNYRRLKLEMRLILKLAVSYTS